MSGEPAEPSPPPAARLNPFVFPSDTTFRFLLLLVAVVGANLYIWNWLHLAVGVDRVDYIRDLLRCHLNYIAATSGSPSLDEAIAANDARTACFQTANASIVWWMVGGTLLLIAVAAAIMFLLPYWIERRRWLRELTKEEAPGVVEELGELAREAQLSEEPRWLWNPLDPSPTGLAFGRPWNHAIALNGGLVTRQIADPPAFRAVVRHELAHLRNHDVDLTYATISLWNAFLLVGVLPFALTVLDEPLGDILRIGWRVLALAALVYLSRNAVLRAREVYADVRASVPDGRDGALRRILAGLPQRSASVWHRLWRVHPDPRARLAAVNDTRRLFPPGLLVAFGTGIATTVGFESMVRLIGVYVDDPIDIHLLAAAIFAPLAMGAVGIGLWRGTWAELAVGGSARTTWPLAAAFAAGLLVGPEIALDRSVPGQDQTLLRPDPAAIPWAAALVVGVVLILAWVAESAESWLRALAGSRRPALVTAAGLVFASGMLAFWVGVFFAVYSTRPALWKSRQETGLDHDTISEVAWLGPLWLYQLIQDTYTLLVLTNPVVFVSLVAVWLFPLLAWLWRKERVVNAEWAFLEPGGHLRVPLLARGSLDPWRVGALAGVACLGAFLVYRLVLRASVEAETREELSFVHAFVHWQIVIALATQAVASMIATARNRHTTLPLVCGLAAAFTTGVIATVGIVVGPSLAGCVDPIAMNPGPCAWQVDASFSWFVLRQVVAEGAVAALAGGFVVLGVHAVLHRRRAPVRADVADAPG